MTTGTRRPRWRRLLVLVVVAVAALAGAGWAGLVASTSRSQLARSVVWGESDVDDHRRFPARRWAQVGAVGPGRDRHRRGPHLLGRRPDHPVRPRAGRARPAVRPDHPPPPVEHDLRAPLRGGGNPMERRHGHLLRARPASPGPAQDRGGGGARPPCSPSASMPSTSSWCRTATSFWSASARTTATGAGRTCSATWPGGWTNRPRRRRPDLDGEWRGGVPASPGSPAGA